MKQVHNRLLFILKVEGLMMDVTAAEEEIKRWKMAAEEEAEAGRSIEQEFQIQVPFRTNMRYIILHGLIGSMSCLCPNEVH